MKWFKHYADMHEGDTVTKLLDAMGHSGLCFFLLQEICAEKLDRPDDELTEADCTFRFHQRIVREKLRLSGANLQRLLDVCAEVGQLSYSIDGNTIEIKMPILLTLLSRDTKRARQQRVDDAQKARLDKDKDKDKDKEREKRKEKFDFEAVYKKYPRRLGKKRGLEICLRQIETLEDYTRLILAVEKYRDLVAREKTEPKYIKHFDTFMNCWRDYVDDDAGMVSVDKPKSQTNKDPHYVEFERIQAAIKHYGLHGEHEARSYLTGPEVAAVDSLGGWTSVWQMGDGEISVKRILRALKDAHEHLEGA